MSMIHSTSVADAPRAWVREGTAMCNMVMSMTTGRKACMTASSTSQRRWMSENMD
ncbi:hypothetical protein D3C86_1977390 [compost metagenome]